MADMPETRYAKTADGLYIAYQVVGVEPPDVVFMPEWVGHVELRWGEPRIASFLRRLASVARVMLFDKRGVGLSDPVSLSELPSLETWADDVMAVLDDVGSERAAIVATGVGGPMAMMFAAMHPERAAALVLVNTTARIRRAPDYPAGVPDRVVEALLRQPEGGGVVRDVFWGTDAEDQRAVAWFERYRRASASPGTRAAMLRMTTGADVRHVLGAIRVPTLVLHRRDDASTRVEHGRYLAEHIPNARLIELDGSDHQFFRGDTQTLLNHIAEFVSGHRAKIEADRVLATVLFTDIVDSTGHADRLGDARWRDLLDSYDLIVRQEIEAFRGRHVKMTGDGTLATFDGPARAVRCAEAITDAVRSLGIEIRSGLHVGEIELRGENDVAGMAVHVAQRVQATAEANEILVSRTVVDLVIGSGIDFEDRGEHELKGVPGTWRMFAVEG